MKEIIMLKVTLDDIKPHIWRRVLVRSSSSFWELHNILQIVFGWENSHLFQFKTDGYFIGLPDTEFEEDSHKTLDAREIKLDKVITEVGYTFSYEYDFGDSWGHTIKVEKFLFADPDTIYPLCTSGERAAPPENCGGVPGFKLLMKSKGREKNPEYDEIMGGRKAFNPENFNVEKVNKQLSSLDSYMRKIEKGV